MFQRRMLSQLAAFSAALLCASTSAAVVDGSRMTYAVFLDDKPIGRHVYEFERVGEELFVQSDVDMSVALLFVQVFAYEHRASERWRAGCLEHLSSRTLQNGEITRISAEVDSEQLIVERQFGKTDSTLDTGTPEVEEVSLQDLSPCLAGYAYWDKALLDRPQLFNAQLGELDDVRFDADGDVRLDWHKTLVARYSLLSNGALIELWYDQSGRWLGLRTKRGKRWLEYRLDAVELIPGSGSGNSLETVTQPTVSLLGRAR